MTAVKKFFLLLACFVALSAFFHKAMLGTLVKIALKAKYGVEIAYSSIDFEKKRVVFFDLVAFDRTFSVHMDRACVALDWSDFPKKIKGHLQIDEPHLCIFQKPEIPSLEESWFDFSVSVRKGSAEWDGLVYFSLDHSSAFSSLKLDWKDSSLNVIRSGGQINAEMKHFKAERLQPFIPFVEVAEGLLTGRVVLTKEMEPLAISLKATKVGLKAPNGSVENMEGTLSFNAALGAKWEFIGVGNAKGKQFPFTWQGRGFFNSHWMETEIEFPKASCQICLDDGWSIECKGLGSEQLTLVQAGASFFMPDLLKWNLQSGTFDAKAHLSKEAWNVQFTGEHFALDKGEFLLVCDHAKGELTQDGGSLILSGPEYDLQMAGAWDHWNADARFRGLKLAVQGGWDGEKFPVEIKQGTFDDFTFSGGGFFDPSLNFSINLGGQWLFAQKQIPFSCPILSKYGADWTFDFRLTRPTWDLFRLCGHFDGKQAFYSEKSHFLGSPLHFNETALGDFDLTLQLPWESTLSMGPLLKKWGIDLSQAPTLSSTDIHFQYKEGKSSLLAKGDAPKFTFEAKQYSGQWDFNLQSDLSLQAALFNDGTARGKGRWNRGVELEFEGRIDPSIRAEFSLPKIDLDLAVLNDPRLEGQVTGQGHFIYDGEIEADFDVVASMLKVQSQPLENVGSIHLNYSSTKGMLFTGLDLHGPFDCIIDVLRYDAAQAHWICHNAQVHLPGPFLTHRLLQFLDKKHDLNFTADLDFASDFSQFSCKMREGQIPFEGVSHQIEDLYLSYNQGDCDAAFKYRNHLLRLSLNIDDQISGRLILGEEASPMAIDWGYSDVVEIHSIEGSFGGVDASFHAEGPNALIGSARVNFTALSHLLPADVAEVFEKIKMGKGYELKGRLNIQKYIPSFQGILTGKHLELFGFQFRTLLAQVELGAEKVRIYDVKISDSAGIMKIDEILLAGKERQPWTIDIPVLTICEMRPSLMQRVGKEPGSISPLVVRELKLTGLTGLVDDTNTYTAKGNLHFINSYKREETVFDVPANLLSRIVGLDLELLIPVTGDLDFEVKDGFFNLTELTNAYSEGNRSEFFLEMDPPPRMDWDGNLQIFIKMKQFVLLKITESFLISIDGVLDDPEFHLQKRRFFGLI